MCSLETDKASTSMMLRQPSSYPDRPDEVEEIETHISHVFLTPRFVYKLKKPVRFDFLDFTTREKRRIACENEVLLNRRLAPAVYQGIVPITRSKSGELSLNGDGEPIDWVVKMRRLPTARNLYHLIITDELLPREIDLLADTLSSFYASQPPLTLQPDTYRSRLKNRIRSNWSELLEDLPDMIETVNRVHSTLLRFLTLRPAALDRRVCDGLIVDGHGDLRPEHVFFVAPLAIIDCIEFNLELREIDVVDELCFLGMECDRLGKPELSQRVLHRYSEETGDVPDPSIVAFYKIYRACVRAKVTALQAAQTHGRLRPHYLGMAQRYLQLAADYLPDIGPQFVIAVTGLMGTGKSTLASALADTLGGELLRTDELRRKRFGRNTVPLSYNAELYSEQDRDLVYGDMLQEAESHLEAGASVILDGTFLKSRQRKAVLQLGRQHGCVCFVIRCECPRKTAITRMRARRQLNAYGSEARPGLYDRQAAEFEPPTSATPFLSLDTRQPLDDQMDGVLDFIKARLEC